MGRRRSKLNISKKKAAAAAAAAAGEGGDEEGKAERFSEAAKTILALAASRESYRNGTSENPLYNDLFYTTVTHAIISAKVVKTDYDFEQTKDYQGARQAVLPDQQGS